MDRPLRVLILEDSPADAELAVQTLRDAGWNLEWRLVETDGTFREALEKPWDVILADYSVGGYGAVPALADLRRRGLDTPCIVVSGLIGEDAAVTLLRAGADDFIPKGQLRRLPRSVERLLREAQERRQRRRAEEERRVLAERWQALLDHATAGIAVQEAICDEHGRLTDFRCLEWNQAAERIVGMSRNQVLGRTAREIFPQVFSGGLLERYAQVMETGVAEQIEGQETHTDPPRRLDISCIRLDGRHFVTILRDVTEQKQAEERLRQYATQVALGNQALERANEELASRNAELEEFAHVASHDLQEPLRKVISFGDLLARSAGGRLDAKSAQYLALMQDATRRLQTLIRDLLVMSRADRTPLRREPTRLEHCVQDALELFSARLQETGATVEVEPLPTLTVDPAQICQLYQNLLSNALKFHAPGRRPHIRITYEATPEGAVLGVADNGIGIEPEFREKIFEAFQRLHGREKYEGSGIGLAVCRKIVHRHHGALWVESQLGEGSHFRFRLQEGESGEARPVQRETASSERT